jgi:hypothetical protein
MSHILEVAQAEAARAAAGGGVYVGGYCIADQAPVRVYRQMVAVDTFGQILERRRLEREAEAAERRARDAVHIKAPTRAERIAALRGDIACAERELADLDNTQRWGRWTQEEFTRKRAPAGATIRLAAALRADMGEAL